MHAKPKKWTHHHIHRLYHLSMLAVFGFASLWVIYGIFLIMVGAQAGSLLEQRSVTVTAMVGVINTTPSEPNNNGVVLLPTPTPKMPDKPFVTVEFKNSQSTTTIISGKKITTRLFDSQFPEIGGTTNIPGAIIFLQINGPTNLNSAANVNPDGSWFWQAGEVLQPGYYKIKVIAQNPYFKNTSANLESDWLIKINGLLFSPLPNNTNNTTKNDLGGLYNILVSIPEKSHRIFAGDQLTVNLRLVNISPNGESKTLQVEYVIQDDKQNIILDSFENISPTNELILQKSFYTSPELAAGRYKLTARISSQKPITTSSDFFEVTQRTPQAPNKNEPANFVVEGLIAILLFFGFVVYFEYNKVHFLTKKINKVTEDDLKKL